MNAGYNIFFKQVQLEVSKDDKEIANGLLKDLTQGKVYGEKWIFSIGCLIWRSDFLYFS